MAGTRNGGDAKPAKPADEALAARYLDLWEAQVSWLAAKGPEPAPRRTEA